MTLEARGDVFELPPANAGAEINRNVYMVEGTHALMNGKRLERKGDTPVMGETDGAGNLKLEGVNGAAEFLILQGRPIGRIR